MHITTVLMSLHNLHDNKAVNPQLKTLLPYLSDAEHGAWRRAPHAVNALGARGTLSDNASGGKAQRAG